MKRITAITAILAALALSASPALAKPAGNKFGPARSRTLHYQTYPFRSGVPIFLATWS